MSKSKASKITKKQEVNPVDELKAKVAKMKEFVEFVIKVDMGMAAPIVNTGCIVPVTVKGVTKLYIVIDMKEFSPFMDAEELSFIQKQLAKGTKQAVVEIVKAHPSLKISSVIDSITKEALTDPNNCSVMIPLFVYESYFSSPYSRLSKIRPFYANFVGRCHIYINRYPAGLKMGTTIQMVSQNDATDQIVFADNSKKHFLQDFIPSSREMIITQPSSDTKFCVAPDLFDFVTEYGRQQSRSARTFVEFLKIFEDHQAIFDKIGPAKLAKLLKK